MEILLALVLGFGGGYFYKGDHVEAECKSEPLITANCPTILPPEDDTFGATTRSYTSLVDQYQKCKAACAR